MLYKFQTYSSSVLTRKLTDFRFAIASKASVVIEAFFFSTTLRDALVSFAFIDVDVTVLSFPAAWTRRQLDLTAASNETRIANASVKKSLSYRLEPTSLPAMPTER